MRTIRTISQTAVRHDPPRTSEIPVVRGMLYLGAMLVVLALVAWSHQVVVDPTQRQSELGETSEFEGARFEQDRADFLYVSDRDETLGQLRDRLALVSVDGICRQIGWSDDGGRCKGGWENRKIEEGEELWLSVGMLHAR